jgi:aspartyl-tRNA(Asn)/glutamyl-tRNA(Gln) amidotransferase subunit A
MELDISLKAIGDALQQRTISSVEICQHLHDKINTYNKVINCFISIEHTAAIIDYATLADNLRNSGERISSIFGIPIAYKDNICIRHTKTSCASLMLDNFIAPYTATLAAKCGANGMISLGKTNMDEFAMGSSNETSYYGACYNPWALNHIPGGSSGGSAAAVAARLVPAAIGTDTGGSIRQPAACCGICGLKPTYGRISRWGVVSYASSLDQAGPIATSAEDCAILFDIMSGHDDKDATSLSSTAPKTVPHLNDNIAGKVLGLPKQYFAADIHPEIQKNLEECMHEFKKLGVTFKEINIPHHEFTVPVYYILSTAEAASNLAKFDGIRYGYRAMDAKNIEQLYIKSRSQGFGREVQKRIMLGTFVLSSGHYDAYYNKALVLREKIKNDYLAALTDVDAIFAPTTAQPAHPIGYRKTSKNEKYFSDEFTISANLAGIPAFAMPTGFTKDGLPTSAQLIGRHDDESLLLNLAHQYQQNTFWHKMQPTISLGAANA